MATPSDSLTLAPIRNPTPSEPQTKQSRSKQSQTKQSQTKQSQTKQPEPKQPEPKQPESKQPESQSQSQPQSSPPSKPQVSYDYPNMADMLKNTEALRKLPGYRCTFPQYCVRKRVLITRNDSPRKQSRTRHRQASTSRRYRVIRTPFGPTNAAAGGGASPAVSTRPYVGSENQNHGSASRRQSSQALQQGTLAEGANIDPSSGLSTEPIIVAVASLSERSGGRWGCEFVRPNSGRACQTLWNSAREAILHFHEEHLAIAVTNPPYFYPCNDCDAFNIEFDECVKCGAQSKSAEERWVGAVAVTSAATVPYIPDLDVDDDEDEGYAPSPRDVALPSVEKEEAFKAANQALIKPNSALVPIRSRQGQFAGKFYARNFKKLAFECAL